MDDAIKNNNVPVNHHDHHYHAFPSQYSSVISVKESVLSSLNSSNLNVTIASDSISYKDIFPSTSIRTESLRSSSINISGGIRSSFYNVQTFLAITPTSTLSPFTKSGSSTFLLSRSSLSLASFSGIYSNIEARFSTNIQSHHTSFEIGVSSPFPHEKRYSSTNNTNIESLLLSDISTTSAFSSAPVVSTSIFVEVDGHWSNWSEWSSCNVSCGGGQQTRNRTCSNPYPTHNGEKCLLSQHNRTDTDERQFRECNTKECIVDGHWGSWSKWSPCNVSCGGGVQHRSRLCDNPSPAHNGSRCLLSKRNVTDIVERQSRECNSQDCPVHGNWGTWMPWSICNVSCGGGKQIRNRTCNSPSPAHNGSNCLLTDSDIRSMVEHQYKECNDNSCLVKCFLPHQVNLKVKSRNATSITFSWNKYRYETKDNESIVYSGQFGHCDVKACNMKECNDVTFKTLNDTTVEEYTVLNLHPFRTYQLKIRCIAGLDGIKNPWSDPAVTGCTDITKPPQIINQNIQSSASTSSEEISVSLWKASDDNGNVKFYYIVVIESVVLPEKSPAEYYSPHDMPTYYEYKKDRKRPYIAAVIDRDKMSDNQTFKIGDSSITTRASAMYNIEQYFNGPLFPATKYYVFQVAHINKKLYSTSSVWGEGIQTAHKPKDGSHTSVIIIIVVIVIILAAVLFIYFTKFRRKNASTIRKGSYIGGINQGFQMDEPAHSPAAHPIKVSNFAAYVQNLAKDGKYLYSEEFKLIQTRGAAYSCTAEHSHHPINSEKNRYNNIVAYDHTRVKLQPIEGVPESEYINANYIDGYIDERAYIATQGPLENTCDHFWRMCWENNVTTIVMLTGTEENGKIKCHQYWPEHGSMSYGLTTITLIEVNSLPTYEIRTFSILHEQSPNEERFIRQYYFRSWPDHGTPYAQELLAFIRRVNHGTPSAGGPTVVHCSAGVGRTGTFIVLDVNMKRIKVEGNIEIYNYLQRIRSQRNYMVQTEAQYVFIHNALLEYLTAGETEIQVRDLRDYVKKLQQPADGSGDLYIDVEFQKLNLFDQSSTKMMNAANASCNKSKNRFLNVLPYDETRVTLRQMPGSQGSDYINANYIHGYSQIKQFIATQAPLPQTIVDFWRMIWEHNCTTIVCLSQETEGGKVKLHRYWPVIETVMHGPLMIEKQSADKSGGGEKTFGDFIVREFKVTHITEGHSRTIKHFQYVGWPDNSYPESGSGMVDLIGHVQKWHQQNGIGQIVVHCSAGVGRTGVFIGLCNMIERVRVEGLIDIFQTVRELRNQRPAMVQTKQEYFFCYLAFQDFLASFDIYQNFI